MSSLTYRIVKGSGLTNAEIDGNFSSLNSSKVETSDCVSTATADKIVKRDSSGNFSAVVISCTDLNSTSDKRVKENITPITMALDIVKQLNGVKFNFIGNPERKIGLIAQDVAPILPEVIGHDGELLTVGYQNIVALLIEAVKDLSEQIAKLQQ